MGHMKTRTPLCVAMLAVAGCSARQYVPSVSRDADEPTTATITAPACCAVGGGRAGHLLLVSTSSEDDADDVVATEAPPAADAPQGMVWVPAGRFTMGTDAAGTWPNEHPPHRVAMDGFWMDVTEVTNDQYAAFVEATGYVTVAEQPIDWEELKTQVPPGTPKPADEMLQPGSLVFTPPDHAVPLNDMSGWWTWTIGANWQHPAGPDSSIEGQGNHPVVHTAWEDAKAYADWAGKSLPTEAQWEYAATGGSDDTRFAWGDTFTPGGKQMANTWTGTFPHINTEEDGYVLAAPVGSFPANGFGLYDMAGNVWEWTADWYRDDRHRQLAKQGEVHNPASPEAPFDLANPNAPSRVVKGGSFLCHVNYCESYRPDARRGLPADTGLQHTGFRCVINP